MDDSNDSLLADLDFICNSLPLQAGKTSGPDAISCLTAKV